VEWSWLFGSNNDPSEQELSAYGTIPFVPPMTSRLSYEEIRRLARAWSNDARDKSEYDDVEIPAWLKEHCRSSPRNPQEDTITDSG
jgi:hypothetical protein